MIFDVKTLLSVSVCAATIHAAALPDSSVHHFLVKRQGGTKFERFGSCKLPEPIWQPMYPKANDFKKYTGTGVKITKGNQNAFNVFTAIPRWYASTIDLNNVDAGQQLAVLQTANNDDIDELEKSLVYSFKYDDVNPGTGPKSKVPFLLPKKQKDEAPVNLDHAWETALMERFIATQLQSSLNVPFKNGMPESQTCTDFKEKILGQGSKPLKDLYAEMPGFDQTKPDRYQPDMIGMDQLMNTMKGLVFSRRLGQYPMTKLTAADGQTAATLIGSMERLVNVFTFMNEQTTTFAVKFQATNKRLHTAVAKIDNLINALGHAKPATLAATGIWADRFKQFVIGELAASEPAAWAWFQQAVPAADALIAGENLGAEVLNNLHIRLNALRAKNQDNFRFPAGITDI